MTNGITKRTTPAQLVKPSPYSALTLTPRQQATLALIQTVLRRRGLPVIESDEEIVFELGIWGSALAKVPDAHLQRTYDRAAEGWDWLDPRRPFTPDAVAAAYVDLVVEARQEAEAERREAAFRNPGEISCYQCCDEGYASVFIWKFNRWYATRRPCFCSAAPAAQRTEPLSEVEYQRDRLGRYARRDLIREHGPPDRTFEALMPAPTEEAETAAEASATA